MITVAAETGTKTKSELSHANESDITIDAVVFDIETGPLSDDRLQQLLPEFVAPPKPGEFDPAAVKCGNLGAAKAAEKIAKAREDHETAVKLYDVNLAAARDGHFAAFKADAALDAITGHVVAIGTLIDGDAAAIDCDGGDESEVDGLQNWWDLVAECLKEQRPMIGFNIYGFDLPFLVRRSWILGVSIPAGVRQGRYWSPLFVDLMRAWGFDGREMIGLNDLARAFGLAGKVQEVGGVAISGADFHKAWRENRAVAEAYLKRDLELPAMLAQRMGVV